LAEIGLTRGRYSEDHCWLDFYFTSVLHGCDLTY